MDGTEDKLEETAQWLCQRGSGTIADALAVVELVGADVEECGRYNRAHA